MVLQRLRPGYPCWDAMRTLLVAGGLLEERARYGGVGLSGELRGPSETVHNRAVFRPHGILPCG